MPGYRFSHSVTVPRETYEEVIIQIEIYTSGEIEDFVEAHICKLCDTPIYVVKSNFDRAPFIYIPYIPRYSKQTGDWRCTTALLLVGSCVKQAVNNGAAEQQMNKCTGDVKMKSTTE